MRAKVAHQPAGNNPTLLPFSRGQIITVMVQQPRNGWLYGNTENGSKYGTVPVCLGLKECIYLSEISINNYHMKPSVLSALFIFSQGWFPASYVEELDDPPMSPNLR